VFIVLIQEKLDYTGPDPIRENGTCGGGLQTDLGIKTSVGKRSCNSGALKASCEGDLKKGGALPVTFGGRMIRELREVRNTVVS